MPLKASLVSRIPRGYRERVLSTDGLLAYWPLDGEPDQLLDQAGDNHLSVIGGAKPGGDTSLLAGRQHERSAEFNRDGALAADRRDALGFEGAVDYTIEFWLRSYDDDSYGFAGSTYPYGDWYGWRVMVQGNGDVGHIRRGPDATGASAQQGVYGGRPAGDVHVAAAMSGGWMGLYLNGASVYWIDATLSLPEGSTTPHVGSEVDARDPISGAVQHFAAYEWWIGEDEIKRHYQAGALGFPPRPAVALDHAPIGG